MRTQVHIPFVLLENCKTAEESTAILRAHRIDVARPYHVWLDTNDHHLKFDVDVNDLLPIQTPEASDESSG